MSKNQPQKYIQVFIEDKNDLPKKSGIYICQFKDGIIKRFSYEYIKDCPLTPDRDYWLDYIDWYLLPIEDNSAEIIKKQEEFIEYLLKYSPEAKEAIRVQYLIAELAELKNNNK